MSLSSTSIAQVLMIGGCVFAFCLNFVFNFKNCAAFYLCLTSHVLFQMKIVFFSNWLCRESKSGRKGVGQSSHEEPGTINITHILFVFACFGDYFLNSMDIDHSLMPFNSDHTILLYCYPLTN